MKPLMFVVVLYEMSMLESPTLRSLSERRALIRDRGLRILVIDNTPGKNLESVTIDSETEYISLGENRGLASAYQAAFIRAKKDGVKFLVLLDQDSEVGEDFISALDNVADE